MNAIYEKMKVTIHVIIIAITLIICAIVLHSAVRGRAKTNTMISVYGLGAKDYVSDLIVWSGSFSKKDMDLKTAYAELDKDKEKISKYLISSGVKEKEIVFSSIDITKENQTTYEKGVSTLKFTGYRLTQRVNIESKDVEKIEEVSRRVTELINSGIEFYSDAPQYYLTKLSDLKLELIGLAAEDGRNRAEAIAEKSKASLGKLKYAMTDVFQITAKYSSEAFTYGGVFNTSSKIKTATITIKIQYNVE